MSEGRGHRQLRLAEDLEHFRNAPILSQVDLRQENDMKKRFFTLTGLVGLLGFTSASDCRAQQFNSDNYWTAPHGVATIVATAGQHYSTLLDVVALFPGWEFNLGATLFKEDEEANTLNHFSTIVAVKHMLYENQAKTGGWSATVGSGVNPSYLQAGTVTNPFATYWFYVAGSFPLFNNTLSLDLLPGTLVNLDQGANDETAWGFTYSGRLAIYKVIPQSAIVGEIFGTEGDAYSKPQYRAGVRWESSKVVAALSYGAAADGTQGAGVELGLMVFTPPFLGIGHDK